MAQFSNQAVVSYNGITVNSNIVTGEISQVLTIEKEAALEKYRHGDVIVYVISMKNTGPLDYSGLRVTDDLGAIVFNEEVVYPLAYTGIPVFYYIDGDLQTTPTVQAGPPLVISDLDLPAGKHSVLIYQTEVTKHAPLGDTANIENTAELEGGGLSEAISSSKILNHNPATDLRVVKSLSPTNVVENGKIVYTFTLENRGAATDADSATVLKDTFAPPLNAPITVTVNGTTWPMENNYDYNEETGVFETRPGQLSVPAAVYDQDAVTGAWLITPGVTTVTISGTI